MRLSTQLQHAKLTIYDIRERNDALNHENQKAQSNESRNAKKFLTFTAW